jgi:hypothetical protein
MNKCCCSTRWRFFLAERHDKCTVCCLGLDSIALVMVQRSKVPEVMHCLCIIYTVQRLPASIVSASLYIVRVTDSRACSVESQLYARRNTAIRNFFSGLARLKAQNLP